MSPPNLWNSLRRVLGSQLYTVSPALLKQISRKAGFEKIEELHSMMQDQYLFRKNNTSFQM
ncbi:MAG: hypothetical protein R6V04_15655 [bacterium]